jgi:FkbM family methyltransferase
MKQQTIIKDDKWVWPIIDEASYGAQTEQNRLIEILLPYLNSKKIMIQAGGNCGLTPNQFSEYFDIIYTFEPDPINFYCLVQNISKSNVIKMQACLGSTNKMVNTQQLLRNNIPHDIGGVYINDEGFTPVFRIDDFDLPYCDLIQLDIEGYEYEALLGAINTIKKYKPVLCIEIYDEWLSRYNRTENEIVDFLSKYGYKHVSSYHADRIFVATK